MPSSPAHAPCEAALGEALACGSRRGGTGRGHGASAGLVVTDYDRIAACAAAYVSARDAGAPDHTLAAQDAVLRSRIALIECLLTAGWTPSPQVHADLALDRVAAEHRAGAAEARAEAGGMD